jgi:hypothetical protein
MAQVVDREQAVGQQLLGSEEVCQVGTAKAPTGAAIALGVNGLLLVEVSGIPQIEAPPGDPGLPIAGNPGGQNRVKEVNAPQDCLEQVNGRAKAHEVPDPVVSFQRSHSGLYRRVPLFWGFISCQPAKVDAIKRERTDVCG